MLVKRGTGCTQFIPYCHTKTYTANHHKFTLLRQTITLDLTTFTTNVAYIYSLIGLDTFMYESALQNAFIGMR